MRNIPALRGEARRFRDLLVGLGRRGSLRDPIAATCEEMQLTPAQIHALLWLGHDGALTMGELARRVGVTEKTATGVVDRLERGGQLHRKRDAADRRVVHVRLTRRGAEAYRRIDAHVNRRVAKLLGRLDRPERLALFRILEKLHDRMGIDPAPPRGGAADPTTKEAS